jgi:hypothetical protein
MINHVVLNVRCKSSEKTPSPLPTISLAAKEIKLFIFYQKKYLTIPFE